MLAKTKLNAVKVLIFSALIDSDIGHKKYVSVAKTKLNTLDVLISWALNNSYISHKEFVLAYNVLREYDAGNH